MNAGVVGCGAIAPMHIESLIAAGIEISCLCDTDIGRAQALKERFALGCGITTDYSALLADYGIDCVHLCTPHYLHKPMILDALKLHKHVFTEKPLCLNLQEAEEIRSVLLSCGGTLGVCFQNRYLPANTAFKKLADRNKNTGGCCYVIWSRDAEYYKSSGWRGKKATEGGGVLINQAIHTLDLLIWFMGDPKFVTASIENHHLKDVIDVEDTAEGYIEFGGAAANFYATTSAPVNLPVEIVVSGVKNLRIMGDKLTVDSKRKRVQMPKILEGKDYWGVGHRLIIADFYDCIKTGRRFGVGLDEAVKSVRLIEKIYESNGNRIEI